jgi:hypothetical protein
MVGSIYTLRYLSATGFYSGALLKNKNFRFSVLFFFFFFDDPVGKGFTGGDHGSGFLGLDIPLFSIVFHFRFSEVR